MWMRRCGAGAPCGMLPHTWGLTACMQYVVGRLSQIQTTSSAQGEQPATHIIGASCSADTTLCANQLKVRPLREAGGDAGVPGGALPKLLPPGVRRRRGLHLLPRQVPAGLQAARAHVSR